MELNYKSFGEGPALIILHGLFGSLDNWQSLAKRFSDEYSVFIVDLRNHGKSAHVDDFSYELMAEDLGEFMDQQGIYSANIVGHSMGGKVAMHFALDQSARVEKLIVVDMAPVSYPPHHTAILSAITGLDLDALPSRKAADALLSPNIPEFGTRQFLMKNILRKKEGGFEWKFNLDVLYREYNSILEEVEADFPAEMPTLFLSGGNSEYVLPEYHERILELFPETSFEVLPDVGHWVHAEAPDKFHSSVMNFLRN